MVQGLGYMVKSLRCRVQGSGFRVQGLGSRVKGSGLWIMDKVQDLGFRV
jgi:hypothetical protein